MRRIREICEPPKWLIPRLKFAEAFQRLAELGNNDDPSALEQFCRQADEFFVLATRLGIAPDDPRLRFLERACGAIETQIRVTKKSDKCQARLDDIVGRLERFDTMSKHEKHVLCHELVAAMQEVKNLKRTESRRQKPLRLALRSNKRTLHRYEHRQRPGRSMRRSSRRAIRRVQTDTGGSAGDDGPGESDEGPIVRRCSLRPDQPKGPPETGAMPAAGYSAEPAVASKLKAGLVVGSRGVGVKSHSDEGTPVPWSRRRRRRRPKAASSFLDTWGITRRPRQDCIWRGL